MNRAKHVLVLGAVLVGCGGGTDATKGAISPSTTATASSVPPPTPAESPPPAAAGETKTAQHALADVAMKQLAALVTAHTERDAKKAAAVYTEDAVLVTPAPVPAVGPQRVTVTGRDGIQKNHQEFYDAIEKPKFGFGRSWIENDVVIIEWVSSFKQAGMLMGVKPTHMAAGVSGLSILWFTPEGLIKAEHRYYDTMTIAGQIGASKERVRPMVVTVPPAPRIIESKDGDDKNIDLLKGLYAALEKKSESDFLSLLSDNPVHDDYSEPEAVRGVDAAKKAYADFTKAFPDGKLKVENAWGVGDYAIAEVTLEGTQQATRKPVKLASVDIARINKTGKIHHVWTYVDEADLLVQIGVAKPPAAPPPAKPEPSKPAPKK